MSDFKATDDLFFSRFELDQAQVEASVTNALNGADDGELFLEYRQSEALGFDDGRLKSASFDTAQGFGLRSVAGEASGYSHASNLDQGAIDRACTTVQAVHSGHSGTMSDAPQGTNKSLYIDDNPINLVPFETRLNCWKKLMRTCAVKQPGQAGHGFHRRIVASRADYPRRWHTGG